MRCRPLVYGGSEPPASTAQQEHGSGEVSSRRITKTRPRKNTGEMQPTKNSHGRKDTQKKHTPGRFRLLEMHRQK
ncbi:hypothetical protein MRX96_056212 [Rhipicephalus microplus]